AAPPARRARDHAFAPLAAASLAGAAAPHLRPARLRLRLPAPADLRGARPVLRLAVDRGGRREAALHHRWILRVPVSPAAGGDLGARHGAPPRAALEAAPPPGLRRSDRGGGALPVAGQEGPARAPRLRRAAGDAAHGAGTLAERPTGKGTRAAVERS